MKYLLISLLLISPTIFAKKLGFTCKAHHPIDPTDRIFFNIILDTDTYNKNDKSVDILVYLLVQQDMGYQYQKVNAFYVSPSETNPQFYIKANQIPFYEHELDFTVYPLAEKMLGYTNLELKKNGHSMDGTCERADYLDGIRFPN